MLICKAKLLSVMLLCATWTVAILDGAPPTTPWPQFRGPEGNGVSSQPHPSKWGVHENVAWTADIEGGGWSSPVVAGDRVFVTTAVSPEFAGPRGFGEGVSSMRAFFASKPPQQPIRFEGALLSSCGRKAALASRGRRAKAAPQDPSFKFVRD